MPTTAKKQTEVLAEICQIADEQQVDVVLIAGDFFDTLNLISWLGVSHDQENGLLTKEGEVVKVCRIILKSESLI